MQLVLAEKLAIRASRRPWAAGRTSWASVQLTLESTPGSTMDHSAICPREQTWFVTAIFAITEVIVDRGRWDAGGPIQAGKLPPRQVVLIPHCGEDRWDRERTAFRMSLRSASLFQCTRLGLLRLRQGGHGGPGGGLLTVRGDTPHLRHSTLCFEANECNKENESCGCALHCCILFPKKWRDFLEQAYLESSGLPGGESGGG